MFTQISPLTYAVYLWPVHCENAMKHNRRRIFNYLQIRDTTSLDAETPLPRSRGLPQSCDLLRNIGKPTPSPMWTESHTLVQTLPCSKLRLREVKILVMNAPGTSGSDGGGGGGGGGDAVHWHTPWIRVQTDLIFCASHREQEFGPDEREVTTILNT